MTTTLSALIDEVASHVYGPAQVDQVAALTADITSTATSLFIDQANQFSGGLIEIDQELILASRVNVATGEVTIYPSGRGFRGSVKAAHTTGAMVTMAPVMPRAVIARELANEISSAYPNFPAVLTTEFSANNPIKTAWPIPVDAVAILDVRWKDPYGNWQRVINWEMEANANLTSFSTGRALFITVPWPSATVRVIYGTRPVPLVNPTDTFESSGLPPSLKDVIVLGTLLRLLPSMDVSRLQSLTVNAVEAGQGRQIGTAMIIGRDLRAEYKRRTQDELAAFRREYPARSHFTR